MKSQLRSFKAARTLLACTVMVLGLLAGARSQAFPRPPGPPWPEGLIDHERFDRLYYASTSNSVADPGTYAESWSGYALRRSGNYVQPYIVPMLSTNDTFKIDPERGAVRLWFRPDWGSLSTGLGVGPGNVAALLTLVTTNGSSSVASWALAFSGDGNTLQLQAQTEAGPAVRMSVPVAFGPGTWHLIALGYTETNSALFLDGELVASGAGLLPVPTNAAPYTSLVLGSDISGGSVVGGQIDEMGTFSGSRRYCMAQGQPFGLNVSWEIAYYYNDYSPVAALGPITDAEIAANKARREQQIAEMQAARQTAASTMMTADVVADAQPEYDPALGFWLGNPQVQGTNLVFNLVNCDTNQSYDIYYTPTLAPTDWRIVSSGTLMQSNFTVPMVTSAGFYRAAPGGGDGDGDGVPNWMDANPKDPLVGALTITIDSPTNHTTLY